MKAALIGIFVGIVAILFIGAVGRLGKRTMYGITLAGIAFLYVGFTWTHSVSLLINIVQAVGFVLLACYGINKSVPVLICGYFLHGVWDAGYSYLDLPPLRPPQYEFFCFAVDFTMGLYLIIRYKQINTIEKEVNLN